MFKWFWLFRHILTRSRRVSVSVSRIVTRERHITVELEVKPRSRQLIGNKRVRYFLSVDRSSAGILENELIRFV